jgi:hypothetical protein
LAAIARARGDEGRALELLREQLPDLLERDAQETALAMVEIADLYRAAGRVADASVLALSARQLASGPGIGLNAAQADRFDSVIASIGADGVSPLAVAIDAPNAVELALAY